MKLRMHIDGGSRGNPGPAACGVVIHDVERDAPLLEAGFYLGRHTNNVAEYRGLLRALDIALSYGATQVDILSDSQLLVRQVLGEYKVKSPDLKPLWEQARQRLQQLPKWSIQHIYREANTRADELANAALDVGEDYVATDHGPAGAAVYGLGSSPGTGPSTPRTAKPAKTVTATTAHQPSLLPPPSVQVTLTAEPGPRCPAAMTGRSFVFTDVTPAGLCLHAAQALLPVVLRGGVPAGGREVICPRCQACMRLTPSPPGGGGGGESGGRTPSPPGRGQG